MTDEEIISNINKVRTQIAEAEKKSNRKEGSVKLCAVSKFHPVEAVIASLKANQFLFGENRVQEAYSKFTEIAKTDEGKNAELHIIGSLQTNKVKKAVEISSCIESVDRTELLDEIEKQCTKLNKTIEVFFEMHTGEESKAGYVDFASLQKDVALCAEGKYPHIVPKGLMTMAPFTEDRELIRKSFVTLRECREKLNAEFPSLPITELSMGMSNDYEIAIQEGSTIVRVGTAIFGVRQY